MSPKAHSFCEEIIIIIIITTSLAGNWWITLTLFITSVCLSRNSNKLVLSQTQLIKLTQFEIKLMKLREEMTVTCGVWIVGGDSMGQWMVIEDPLKKRVLPSGRSSPFQL